MIKLKSDQEIEIMAQGGKLLSEVCSELISKVRPGITGIELDKMGELLIKKVGGVPSFKKVKGYNFTTCICVNDTVVHGLPNNIPFNKGDIVGIDIGIYYKGFHNDMSWTVFVGEEMPEHISRFLSTGKLALKKAIEKIKIGNHIGDISKVIEEILKKEGYKPVKILVGHGIGKDLHEDPQIPGFLNKEIIKTPRIEKGMVLAVEIIYSMGDGKVVYKNNDGWTIATRNGSLAGLFEHTVAVNEEKVLVLTRSDKFDKIIEKET